MLWSDNMVIPVGAPEPDRRRGVHELRLRPENQAQIEAYVNYVSPVAGTKEILLKDDPEIANNKLIFPPEQFTKNATSAPAITGKEEQEITQAFDAAING